MIIKPEARLISRCLCGETAAWDELFNCHYVSTCSFVFQLGLNFTREDAEEVSQEVFLNVVRNLKSFRGNCQFQTWLFRIALNNARDYRQRKMALKRGGGREPISLHWIHPETGLTWDIASNAPEPDVALVNAERLFLLGQALDGLESSYRELLELRYFAGLSYEAISKILDLNTKTVGSRLNACLTKLKVNLDKLVARQSSQKSRDLLEI
ncbi:MAG: polymerase subunit sigma-24 [Verrucomicrobiales bacterium]|nr:polymerase subunit sigma-24 [Verrucomicrobiales bacterium]